jgi:biotin carboxyl carrier protein
MLKAIVNGKTHEVTQENGNISIDGSVLDWDLVKIASNGFHILYKNRSYNAELVKHDPTSKTVSLKINGQVYHIEVKDRYDLLLEKMGMNGSASGKVNHVKAPMPGLIVQVNVAAGDKVKPGDPLLVLEAMKMENMIKASGDGEVKNINVKKGDSVEKGQVLIEFQQ